MKKNNPDAKTVGDLLKKLHASYSEDHKKNAKQAATSDGEDSALLDQLKATLDKASEPQDRHRGDRKKKKARKAKDELFPQTKEVQTAAAEEAPLKEEAPLADEINTVPEEQPIEVPSPVAKKEKKKQPRARAPRQAATETTVEQNTVEEAAVTATDAVTEQSTELEASSPAPAFAEPEAKAEAAAEPKTEETPASPAPVIGAEEQEQADILPTDESLPAEVLSDANNTPDAEAMAEEPQPQPKVIKKIVKIEKTTPKPKEAPARSITIPRTSCEYDFAKAKPEAPQDSIVIRPQDSKKKTPSESIVIRPRVQEYTPPKPKQIEAPPAPQTHVTIDAMQKKKEKTELITNEKKDQKKISLPQNTQNDFLIEQTADADTVKTEAEQTDAPVAPTVAKTAKRKVRRIRSTKITTLPEEELLNVALDDAAEEMLLENTVEEIPVDAPEELSRQAEDAVQPTESVKKTASFRRRRPQKQAEQSSTLSETVQRRSGLSENDIAMMFELGYENELGRLVGYETMKKLRYEHLRRNSHSEQRHYRTALGYRNEEYQGAKQNETVLAAYAHDKRVLIRRLLLTALLTLITFFLDAPYYLGGLPARLNQSFPLLFPILGIAALVLCAAISYRSLYAGARSLMRFSPTPYSVISAVWIISALYSLSGLLPFVTNKIPVNFSASVFLLCGVIGDMLRLCGELRAFRILSSPEQKTVLEPATPRKKKLRHGDKIVRIVHDDLGENLYRVDTAEQTTGFFRRFNYMASATRPITVLLVITLAAAFAAGVITAILTGSLATSLSVFVVAVLLSAPLSILFIFFYPLCRANTLLYQRSCALIGEEAVDELADEQTVIFNDTDLFYAEKCANIAVREGDDFRNDIRLAEILFRKMGGTLGSIAISTQKSKEPDPAVAIVRITDIGVEAVIDNRYHVLLGSSDFLRKSGVRVPKESSDMLLRRAANVSMMYVAIDGMLKLSYELQYKLNRSFEDVVAKLAMDGTAVAVLSYDPNLTDTFLQSTRHGLEDSVYTVRPGRFEAETALEVSDTGAVTLGKRRDIALPIHAAKCIRDTRRRSLWIQFVAMLLGVGLATVLPLIGYASLITPLSVAAYQAVCTAVTYAEMRTSLSAKNLYIKE